MKTWLKRTLIGVAACAAVAGSLAAYSQAPADPAVREAHMLEHVGKRLNLDANQSARLKALADLLHAQHAAGGDLHRRVQALFAGNTFDRAGAQQLVSEKVAQVQASGPAVINAVGDFYDSLNATQQQQVRDFMARAHHHGMWMHHHGASAPAGN
ncbi:MAG TPA: Spy/CpxP family protein refolding chaperone [Burkholderiaceae bacterium]